jgi:phenylacetate-CoA ligase
MDRDSIERMQVKRLRIILKAASKTARYRKVMEGDRFINADLDDLSLLPFTTKEELRDSPDSFIPEGISKSSLIPLRTSGSTGRPLKLYIDREAAAFRLAAGWLVHLDAGRRPFGLIAEIIAKPNPPHPILASLGLFRKAGLSVFDPFEKNHAALRKLRPDMLRSYPSTLTVLAKMNNAEAKPLKVRSVFSSTELLTPNLRKIISESFSSPIFNQYGSAEFHAIAWECPEEHGMHVNASSSLLEIVDRKGRPIRSGVGEVVITSLHNKAMPLIRYRLGDLASWGGECRCGRGWPVLKSLEGRKARLIVLPSGRLQSAIHIDLIHDIEGVLSYQVVQEKPDLFVFRYVPYGKDISEDAKKQVRQRITRDFPDEKVIVEFQNEDKIPLMPSGKLDAFISKVPSNVLE